MALLLPHLLSSPHRRGRRGCVGAEMSPTSCNVVIWGDSGQTDSAGAHALGAQIAMPNYIEVVNCSPKARSWTPRRDIKVTGSFPWVGSGGMSFEHLGPAPHGWSIMPGRIPTGSSSTEVAKRLFLNAPRRRTHALSTFFEHFRGASVERWGVRLTAAFSPICWY